MTWALKFGKAVNIFSKQVLVQNKFRNHVNKTW